MKRLLSWLLAALMLLTMLPTAGWADDTASGTCGENLTWTLSDDGVLTISGTGDMTDYYSYSEFAPWHEYADRIQTVIIGKGVTGIGSYAFSDCSSLTSVSIPDSVTSIGYGTFYGCSSLPGVTIPNGVTSIGALAFENCNSLTNVNIPNGVTYIEYGTFYGCSSLTGEPNTN